MNWTMICNGIIGNCFFMINKGDDETYELYMSEYYPNDFPKGIEDFINDDARATDGWSITGTKSEIIEELLEQLNLN